MGTSIASLRDRVSEFLMYSPVRRDQHNKIIALPNSTDWEYLDRLEDFKERSIGLEGFNDEEINIEFGARKEAMKRLRFALLAFDIDEEYYQSKERGFKEIIETKVTTAEKMGYLVVALINFKDRGDINSFREFLMVLNLIHRHYQNRLAFKDYSFFHGLIYSFTSEEISKLVSLVDSMRNRDLWQLEG